MSTQYCACMSAYTCPMHSDVCGDAVTRINQAAPKPPCAWTEDSDGIWETDCGEAHVFLSEGPVENNARFCCYCGAPLVERAYTEDADAEHAP